METESLLLHSSSNPDMHSQLKFILLDLHLPNLLDQRGPTAGPQAYFGPQIITAISVITIGLPCVPKIPDMSGIQVFYPEIIWLSEHLLHSRPTLVFKPLILHLPILCLLPLPPHHRLFLLADLLYLLLSLPLTLSGFFNGMLEVFEPGALNYSTFFRSILPTLSVFRNPILTHLPLFESWILCSEL